MEPNDEHVYAIFTIVSNKVGVGWLPTISKDMDHAAKSTDPKWLRKVKQSRWNKIIAETDPKKKEAFLLELLRSSP
jgi:hypothetical protein